MTTETATRMCKNRGCTNPVPPAKPGHRPPLTCSDACRKAASRTHLRDEERRQEEAARQQPLARWQVFQPTTRSCLERVAAVGGVALAEHLAEAIRRERERSMEPAAPQKGS
ncbi:MAG TPA: hypothetical protein VKT82_08510 [Ktedonobacterales bacterium]|nr:hypothetical protein [Ktedonobacterales bacterium]